MKKIILTLTMLLAILSIASCSFDSKTTIEFVDLPNAVYPQNYSEEQFKNEVSIKIGDYTTNLANAQGVIIAGLDFETVGTHTLVVVYNSVSITFEYSVVAETKEFTVTTYSEFEGALAQGGIIKLANEIKVDARLVIQKSVSIYGNNFSVTPSEKFKDDRIFHINEDNVKVNFYDLNVSGTKRAINTFDAKNVDVTVKHCNLSASYYTFNIASKTDGSKFSIEDSELSGWGLINVWSNNAVISVKNTKFNSHNAYVGDSNSFGAVVLNGGAFTWEDETIKAGDTGQDNELLFEECTFNVTLAEESIKSGITQHVLVIQNSCDGNVVNFNKCSLNYYGDMLYLRDNLNPAGSEVYIDGVRK